jgi:hypothetical protein
MILVYNDVKTWQFVCIKTNMKRRKESYTQPCMHYLYVVCARGLEQLLQQVAHFKYGAPTDIILASTPLHHQDTVE